MARWTANNWFRGSLAQIGWISLHSVHLFQKTRMERNISSEFYKIGAFCWVKKVGRSILITEKCTLKDLEI